MGKRQKITDILQMFIVLFLFMFIVHSVIFIPVEIDGHSMYPTLEDGNRGIVNRLVPYLGGYERFDIVVFQATKEDTYVKRIIGMPGDDIMYWQDQLYVNGEIVEEPFLHSLKQATIQGQLLTENFSLDELFDVKKVPAEHYFVLGDNRRGSIDSRSESIGFVSASKIKGKLDVILWPGENRQFVN